MEVSTMSDEVVKAIEELTHEMTDWFRDITNELGRIEKILESIESNQKRGL
jgi:uncharacterized membrane protein YfbV (UPF0208 family)